MSSSVAGEAEAVVNKFADEDVDSTDSPARYAAYTSRFMTAIRTSSRYVAYTHQVDLNAHENPLVGEAFRPVVTPSIVRLAYAISWTYLTGDVAYETYKAKRRGPTQLEAATYSSEHTRLAMAAVQRSVFQGVASMALPAFTIHTVVRHAPKLFKRATSPRIKAWGPTFTGLAVVPVLPYLFDHPVENITERAFHWIEERIRETSTSSKSKG